MFYHLICQVEKTIIILDGYFNMVISMGNAIHTDINLQPLVFSPIYGDVKP